MGNNKEPVDLTKELRSDMWGELTIQELWSQKIILQSRIDTCRQLRNPAMLKQMERGMVFLQAIIEENNKNEKHESSIF